MYPGDCEHYCNGRQFESSHLEDLPSSEFLKQIERLQEHISLVGLHTQYIPAMHTIQARIYLSTTRYTEDATRLSTFIQDLTEPVRQHPSGAYPVRGLRDATYRNDSEAIIFPKFRIQDRVTLRQAQQLGFSLTLPQSDEFTLQIFTSLYPSRALTEILADFDSNALGYSGQLERREKDFSQQQASLRMTLNRIRDEATFDELAMMYETDEAIAQNPEKELLYKFILIKKLQEKVF